MEADIDHCRLTATLQFMWKVTLLLAAITILGGCSNPCNNNLIARSDAPDGRHSAVMFQRDCGATTGFSTQISILSPVQQATGSGNVFRADE